MKHAKENKKRKTFIPLAIALLFTLGAATFVYPTVSYLLAEQNAGGRTDGYVRETYELDDESMQHELDKAVLYNQALAGDPVRDPFVEGSGTALPKNYTEVLNINGIICTVEIPKIHVNLPVYHGTSESVLRKGAGHIRQTAFPIGGEGNNPVITAHTGIADAKLFTDLDKLEKGDIFIIHVLKETLYYEVEDISIILPEEVSNLNPIPGKDCVTLLTCTPYAVNTHRLLVRGIRTEPTEEEIADIVTERTFWEFFLEYKAIFIVIFMFLLMVFVLIVYFVSIRKRKKRKTGLYWQLQERSDRRR